MYIYGKLGIVYITIYLLLSTTLSAIEIEFVDIISKTIPVDENRSTYYEISAEKYIEKFKKNSALKLFINRKSFMSKNNYYSNGIFKSKKTKLYFKKGYILFSKVYLFDVKGFIDKAQVKAKEIIFDGYKSYILKKCEVKIDNHIYRRNIFRLSI